MKAASHEPSALPAEAQSPVPAAPKRLMSLDALRGFDMFWIVGGEGIIHGLADAYPESPFFKFLRGQVTHKAWAGFAFYDLIFPLFIFIVGVSLVFSLSRMLERDGRSRTLKRIVFRTIFLYVCGLLVYGGISQGVDQVRWMGVLQRIAICYGFTAILFCLFRLRGLVVICVSLLLGYWAVTSLVPIRDFNLQTARLQRAGVTPRSPETRALFLATTNLVRGRFEDGLNLPQQIDFQYLPGRKWDGAYDPEGILSTFPAIATCLLGVFAGRLLRNRTVAEQKKVWLLIGWGMGGVIAGFAWGVQFPVIKKIWTSSFVLVAGGYSCLLLGAFYQIVEIWQWRRWCTPFVWIGTNAITIYLAAHVVPMEKVAELFVGGPLKQAFGAWGEFLVAATVVGIMLAFVRFLYQRKIFLRF